MTKVITIVLLHVYCGLFSQTIKERLTLGFKSFEADSQCRHGLISLYVFDDKTGSEIFDKNGDIGLAPTSCQKIVTSATAFELLGKTYTYKTQLGFDGSINQGILKGNLHITGNGDPTLGSWRYKETTEKLVLDEFTEAIKQQGIKKITGGVVIDNPNWETQIIPGGWTWDDIGNYYGAGASGLNWRENQYDLILKSGKRTGDSVKIIATKPAFVQHLDLINEVTSAQAGSGDNTIIYFATGSKSGYIRGTIPVNQDHFVVSGSMPDGALQLSATLYSKLNPDSSGLQNNKPVLLEPKLANVFHTHTSPALDSINFWFLRKSINLYGEALVKTIAYEKSGHASTDSGVNIIKNFWVKRGVDKTAMNIIDGSGLSPANRITTNALVHILQYAKKQNWFFSFYNALPEINGIKMKSGSISGVLSYAGLIKSKSGNEYTFAFIINNYNGSSAALKEKMWKLLDILK